MLFSNPYSFNQIGRHINTAVYLETSLFGGGILVLQMRMGVFRIVHGTYVVHVLSDLQQCNIFLLAVLAHLVV